MTPGMFYGGWTGAALVALHLLFSFRKQRKPPSMLRLCATFAAVVGVSTAVTPVWPILASPTPGAVDNPANLIMPLWLGMFSAIGLGAMALLDNWKDLGRSGTGHEEPPER